MNELKGDLRVYEKGGMRVIQEYFPTIYHLLNVLEGRENNYIMKDKDTSQSNYDPEWFGTESYQEAVQLLTSGYTDVLDKLKYNVSKMSKSINNIDTRKSSLVSDVCGYVPIVPNYLKGLPKTMCYRQPIPKKIKTINIIYNPDGNADVPSEKFLEAGIAMLSAIRAIEKGGISVKLDCMFFNAVKCDEAVVGIVRLKNYKDRLDLQKLCFPLVHSSMLRRIGFKYLETVPDLREGGFCTGYGSTPSLSYTEEFFQIPKSTVLINLDHITEELSLDPEKIINYINSKL